MGGSREAALPSAYRQGGNVSEVQGAASLVSGARSRPALL